MVAAVAHRTGWWLPLHLFLAGGLLSAISAATQMLAVTWSSSSAPHPMVAAIQRWVLATGAVAVVIGGERDIRWLVGLGGVAVGASLLAMVPILLGIRRSSVTDRFMPAIDAFIAAFLFGVVGTAIGVVLGTGRAGGSVTALRDAHLIVNLFGLVGLVIAATLPFFLATQVRAKMSLRATPVVLRANTATLVVATATAGVGRLFEWRAVTATGLVVYAAALAWTVVLLPIFDRRRWQWAGPRLVQLLTGVGWWIAMTLTLAVVLTSDSSAHATLQALVIGGFAQIFVASLAYLGPVLRGGGHERLTAGFAITRSWLSVVAGNVAAVGAIVEQPIVMLTALAIWLADITARALRLAGRHR